MEHMVNEPMCLCDDCKATRQAQSDCAAPCSVCEPQFDEQKAKGLSAREVRRLYPRFSGACKACGFVGVRYASWAHYVGGDW